jgi:Na+/H+-dicarboxylate symporter
MNAIGVFAGRGDVLAAMFLAVLVGIWLGWHAKRFSVWLKQKKEKP